MASHENGSTDRFVDERMSTLEPGRSSIDMQARLGDAHARQLAARVRGRRWSVAGLAAAVVLVAVPGTRAVGARCVEACVNATTRVSQLWRADEPEATAPKVVGVTLGDIAPDLVGTDSHGQPIRLSSWRGRVVVLNFWATWCGPCRAEVPLLNDLQARFAGQGLAVVGVALDAGGWDAIRDFAGGTPIDYTAALGTDDVSDAYGGVNALPMTFVIDRAGLIVIKHKGPVTAGTFDEQISKMLER
jgi:thiol-disulfide isomerase/thioredoxin